MGGTEIHKLGKFGLDVDLERVFRRGAVGCYTRLARFVRGGEGGTRGTELRRETNALSLDIAVVAGCVANGWNNGVISFEEVDDITSFLPMGMS